MDLFQSNDNRMPPDPVCDYLRTPDGVRLRYARWKTLRPPAKGTIVLLQGRTEYIEKYYETITNFRKAGFEVATFDWRGQGGSDRQVEDGRGHVDSFEEYVTDLETIMQDVVLPDCRAPLFIVAHSTGALVALLAAPRLANKVERMVLLSPLIRFGDSAPSQRLTRFVAGILSALGLGTSHLGRRTRADATKSFAANRLTSDTRRFTRNAEFLEEHPELFVGPPTAGWLFAACRAMDQVDDPDFIATVSVPTLLACAGNDRIVSNRAIEELGFRLLSGRTLTVDGARHEILQERDSCREQLLAAITAFVPGTSMVA